TVSASTVSASNGVSANREGAWRSTQPTCSAASTRPRPTRGSRGGLLVGAILEGLRTNTRTLAGGLLDQTCGLQVVQHAPGPDGLGVRFGRLLLTALAEVAPVRHPVGLAQQHIRVGAQEDLVVVDELLLREGGLTARFPGSAPRRDG